MQELRNATFCAVFPGNGWGHLEAPIIMGCIPVVVQDEILVYDIYNGDEIKTNVAT